VVRSFAGRASAVAAAMEELDGFRRRFHGEMPPREGANDKGMRRWHWIGAHLLFDHFLRHARAEHEFLGAALTLLDNPEGKTFFVESATEPATDREVES
jgi:hypothetical protein